MNLKDLEEIGTTHEYQIRVDKQINSRASQVLP
jgi:hypothetical protein